jgi:acylphosphatase
LLCRRICTEQAAFKAIVTGLVQGVGYRYYAVGHARRLGIGGYAKNLPGDRVEVYAEGEKGPLEEFLKLLGVGPVAAQVAGLAVEWKKPAGSYKTFGIEY